MKTHKTSGDGRGWVDELSIPFFSTNVSSYIAISPIRGDGGAGIAYIIYLYNVETLFCS